MGNLTELEYFYTGQVVKLKNPGATYAGAANRFTVTKVNPVKLKVVQNISGKSLQGHQTIFTALAPEEKDSPAAAPVSTPKSEVNWSTFRAGVVVRYTATKRPPAFKYAPDQLFFVMKHNFDLVNIVPIGGSTTGRYWRMSPLSLTIVDPTTVHAD